MHFNAASRQTNRGNSRAVWSLLMLFIVHHEFHYFSTLSHPRFLHAQISALAECIHHRRIYTQSASHVSGEGTTLHLRPVHGDGSPAVAHVPR